MHGSSFCATPNLDKMAKEGIDFANFTVGSPVCSPSRAAVMTGQFPAVNSIHQHFQGVKAHIKRGMPDWLDPQAPMLPRYLKEAGYKTGHFGKWHLGSSGDSPTEDKYGYDSFATFNGSKVNPIRKDGLASVDFAEKFIRENKDEPFFVNLWLHEVHTAHYPLDRYMEEFNGLTDKQQVYASVIAEGDEAVGRIMKLLDELGLDDNTLVVFSTDNGPEKETDEKIHDKNDPKGLGKYYSVGETGGLKGEKRSLFAGGIRVPFIVRWPNVAPAGRIDRSSVITAVDLLPTFLEAAGVALPDEVEADGESALAAFKGEEFERTKPIYWEWRGGDNGDHTWPNLAMRDGKWKLIINEKQDKTALYDLEADWAEKNDLSADFPEVEKELRKKLRAWKSSLPTEPSPNALSKARSKFK